jgi:hypothetical protein
MIEPSLRNNISKAIVVMRNRCFYILITAFLKTRTNNLFFVLPFIKFKQNMIALQLKLTNKVFRIIIVY